MPIEHINPGGGSSVPGDHERSLAQVIGGGRGMSAAAVLTGTMRCDNVGCDETHPLEHEYIGQPGFAPGKWLGWVYLDLDRPDLINRTLAFCGVRCLSDWVAMRIQKLGGSS